MADEPQDEVLELEEDDIVGDEADEQAGQQDGEAEELTFADEEAEQPEASTDLVKHLRQQIRERDKRLAQVQKPVEQLIEVGPRPTLDQCLNDGKDIDEETEAWIARRDARAKQDAKAEQQQASQNAEWAKVQQSYASKMAQLSIPDKGMAEAVALEVLTPVQQAVIAKTAENPALIMVALGKRPTYLDRIAAIDDPLVLAAEIGRMGATLKVSKGKRPPEPERIVRGGTVSVSGDKAREKLEAEADRTGDRTKLIAYNASKRK